MAEANAGAALRASRYGSPRRPWRRAVSVVAVGLLAAAGLGWVLWAGWNHANPPLRVTLVGYTVDSDHAVTVRFDVVKERERVATCRIRARNQAGVEVGSREVTVPAGVRTATASHRLTTTERAVTGEVRDCRLSR